jgi:predicted porin
MITQLSRRRPRFALPRVFNNIYSKTPNKITSWRIDLKKLITVASIIMAMPFVAFSATKDSSGDQETTIATFGLVDLALQKVTAGSQSQLKMVSGSTNTSRLGWTASRPIDSGLTASIWLEAGLTPTVGDTGGSNGSTTVLFNRRSTLSLTSNLGELRLGRDYSPTYTNALDFDPFGTIGLAGVNNIIDTTLGSAAKTSSRANNQVQLMVPKGNGIYGAFTVSPSDGTAAQGFMGGRVGYENGTLNVAVGIQRTQNPGFADFVTTNGGISYQFSDVKLGLFSNKNQFANLIQQTNELSAVIRINAKDVIRTAYTSANASGPAAVALKDNATMMAVGYRHNFDSKTEWYATYSQIQNKNNGVFNLGGLTTAPGTSTSGYEAGLVFKF